MAFAFTHHFGANKDAAHLSTHHLTHTKTHGFPTHRLSNPNTNISSKQITIHRSIEVAQYNTFGDSIYGAISHADARAIHVANAIANRRLRALPLLLLLYH